MVKVLSVVVGVSASADCANGVHARARATNERDGGCWVAVVGGGSFGFGLCNWRSADCV